MVFCVYAIPSCSQPNKLNLKKISPAIFQGMKSAFMDYRFRFDQLRDGWPLPFLKFIRQRELLVLRTQSGKLQSGEEKGIIARIQPFVIHNGPGIRTVIYMKGCTMRCIWCAMPHLQKDTPEPLSRTDKCIKLKNCSSELTGRYYSIEELIHIVEKDIPIFRRSSGGVTISGGEPALQAEFLSEFLRRCKQLHVHTAMETTGLIAWGKLSCLIAQLDLIYFNVKHMDGNKHNELTGSSNHLILENIRKASRKLPLIIRVPIIKGLNDDEPNMSLTAKFAKDLGDSVIQIELIPFLQFGGKTHLRLDKENLLSDLSPTDETVMKLKEKVESFGLRCQIGG